MILVSGKRQTFPLLYIVSAPGFLNNNASLQHMHPIFLTSSLATVVVFLTLLIGSLHQNVNTHI